MFSHPLVVFYCLIVITNRTNSLTKCSSDQIPKGKPNQFHCEEKSNNIVCSLSNSTNLTSAISLCGKNNGWTNEIIKYEENITNQLSNYFTIQENSLNIGELKSNVTYTFSICKEKGKLETNASQSKNAEDKNANKQSCDSNSLLWDNYQLIKNGRNITIINIKNKRLNQMTNEFKFNETHVYLNNSLEKSSWKLHKGKLIKAQKNNYNPCIINITHSGILGVSVVTYLKNSSLNIALSSANKTNSTTATCTNNWQKVKLQIKSVNNTILKIEPGSKNDMINEYLAIYKIKIYEIENNTKNKVSQTKPSTTTTTPLTTTTTTPLTTTTTPLTTTTTPLTTTTTPLTTTTTPLTTTTTPLTTTTTPLTTTTTPLTTTTTPLTTTTPSTTTTTPLKTTTLSTKKTETNITLVNSTDDGSGKLAAFIVFLILVVLSAIFLGYLGYAYKFKKYPFELLQTSGNDSSQKEFNEFSDHYKKNKLKTVRTKADPPAEESELQVLIESPNNINVGDLTSLPVNITNFEEYLIESLGDDPYSNELTKQYRRLQTKIVKSTTTGSQPKYVNKNRYKNLIAYDETRVILKNNDDCDYINANYVDGYENAKAFIATQAPSKSTLGDFWWMIWQEQVTFIVMLTELIENGVIKCEQYWPDDEQNVRYGKILIKHISTKISCDFVERKLSVKCGDETREIHHLQYMTWPDHGVPLYPQNFTPFIKKMLLMPQKEAPIVVHCNAGCGRTGTLILCDIILRMAAKERNVDFVKVLRKMREQRRNVVNNVNQYVFAHFVVLECLFGVDFSIPINDSFQDEVHKVLRKTTIKPIMEHLDKVMKQFKKRQICFTPNMSDDDKKKNRFTEILPGHSQVHLSMSSNSENPSSYINAVVVDCYRCPKKFIVTQQPLPNTVDDFWTLIKEYEVNTIVSLNEISENDPNCPQFWHCENATTKLQIVEESENRIFYTTKIKITDPTDQKTDKTINLLRLKNWKKETANPIKPNNLILLWKEMFNTSWKGNSQIVITCYDGATASGLFVALIYLLEKMNYEHSCDVFSAIRTVRQSRDQFVQDWAQIEFLYKAAKVYIEEFDNYENFSN